ncbi:MAG: hypothetical protein P4L84_34100 [Isosphaeraceae bacterium]|nr:hypothetical protein [Isosphaeraceae bacterium]
MVEDNLALFITLGWKSGEQLTYLRCQSLAVQGADLESYYLGADCEEYYLRLDFDATQLGPIFTHPLPHVHAQPHGGARFPLDAPHSGNALIDFVEFTYRSFCHDVWIDWAREVWAEEVRRRAIEDDPFDPIIEAFQANQVNDLLTKYREHLNWMKATWRREKDAMFPLRVGDDHRKLLSYTS